MQFARSSVYENMLRKCTFSNRKIFVEKKNQQKEAKARQVWSRRFLNYKDNHWKKSIITSGRFLATETKDENFFQGKHWVIQIDTDPGKS